MVSSLILYLVLAVSVSVYAELPENSLDKPNAKMIVRAQQYYGAGRIDDAEDLALKIITENNHLTNYEKYNTYRLLAFCSIAADNVEAGKRYFISAIRYYPNMSADPLTWSPKLRTVFDSAIAYVLQQEKSELEWIYASQAQLGRRASLKSLYMPGAGQLMKHQNKKGLTLGILTFTTVSAFLYGQTYLHTVRDKYLDANTPAQAEKRWKDYRNARYMVSITGLAALAIYGYTFFDALWAAPATEAIKLPVQNIDP